MSLTTMLGYSGELSVIAGCNLQISKMKMDKMFNNPIAFFTIVIILGACTMQVPANFIESPSRRYQLKVDLNRDKSDEKNYNCVALAICDTSYRELSRLQTGASNNMKWAVGWYPVHDTLILNSKDIGVHAYKISENHQLLNIPVGKEIEQQAEIIFTSKYADK
jgi:hypothetical protein